MSSSKQQHHDHSDNNSPRDEEMQMSNTRITTNDSHNHRNNDDTTNDRNQSDRGMQPPTPRRQSSLDRLRHVLNPGISYNEGVGPRHMHNDDGNDNGSASGNENGNATTRGGRGSAADNVRLKVNSEDNTISIMFDDGSSVTVEVHPNVHHKLHSKVKEHCCSNANLGALGSSSSLCFTAPSDQQNGNGTGSNDTRSDNDSVPETVTEEQRDEEVITKPDSRPHHHHHGHDHAPHKSHFHIHIPSPSSDEKDKVEATKTTKKGGQEKEVNEVRKSEDGSYTIVHHVKKYRGRGQPTPPYVQFDEGLSAFLASFLSIAVLALLQFNAVEDGLHDYRHQFIIGSFGASAVLLYGAIESDLAQPRNVIGGHVISAIVGVCIQQIFIACSGGTSMLWLACAFSVSFAITAMNAFRCLHPPAGATALIAILPSPAIQDIGWMYIGLPVAVGAGIMVIIAVIFNNIPRKRHWPKSWI